MEIQTTRYEAQAILFSAKIPRLALLNLSIGKCHDRLPTVNVWRNHGIESLIPLTTPFFDYQDWKVDFRLGGYDDTLMFGTWQAADAEMLWIDSVRFLANMSFGEWLTWLAQRLAALRAVSRAPIILATWSNEPHGTERLQAVADGLPAVYFADLQAACGEFNVPLLDSRSAALAGTPLSSFAQLVLARALACHWLPAALSPPIKAVALDLDNTLHEGVLGEDGVHGVRLTPGHAALQSFVKSLRARGIFLALVSRNELSDVEALFAARRDYPLCLADFSAVEVTWGDKAAALSRIASALRIAPDALVFVDDNPGELASVAMQLPQVHTVYAHPNADLTRRVLAFYPGLWRWRVESEDTKRVQDLHANTEREALAAEVADPADYFRGLQVKLTFRSDPTEQLARLADLCNKTNQFNLALRRFNLAEVAACVERSDTRVTSVQLTDRLSDSGVIAVIVAMSQGEQLVVNELCISCRAMGRQLEDTMILTALRESAAFFGHTQVAFRVGIGPRNQPALAWLARLIGQSDTPAAGLHVLPVDKLLEFPPAEGVVIAWNDQ